MPIYEYQCKNCGKISEFLIVEKFRDLDIEKVAPTHCTGKNATKLFKEAYGDNFIEVKVGGIIDI